MKKNFFLLAVVFFVFSKVFAGGILTNTNQNVSFLRNPARDASIEIDAAYTNPAGLAFLSHEGLSLSINNQSAFQTRTITTDFPPFGSSPKAFEGKAKALVIPDLQAAYKTGDWVISANIGVVGGGGTLDFSKGLPSFESQFAVIPDMLRQNGIPLPQTEYSLDSRLKGSSLIIGVQLGATYKISDQFSAYLGGRMSIVNNSYDGYIRNFNANVKDGGQYDGMRVTDYLTTVIAPQLTGAGNSLQPLIAGGLGDYKLAQVVAAGLLTQAQADQLAANSGLSTNSTVKDVQSAFFTKAAQVQGAANQVTAQTANVELNTKQTGSGFAPIIGFNYNWNGLNIGAKYEFKTRLDLTNKTTANSANIPAYSDGVKTPYDIPALFTFGAQYDITLQWTVSAGYHHFFDSDARMSDVADPNHPGQVIGREKLINGGVNEYLAGIEYRINDRFLVSCGTQFTRQGVTKDYESDMTIALNSYSLGFGGAINITENIRVNLAYFFTNYDNWTVGPYKYASTQINKTDVYGRTNHAFGIGVDLKF